MKGKGIFVALCLLTSLGSYSQKINPANPDLSPGNFKLDSLPNSEINIPIQINLKPMYAMAEKSVDTVFTSPGWPDGWVQSGAGGRRGICAGFGGTQDGVRVHESGVSG